MDYFNLLFKKVNNTQKENMYLWNTMVIDALCNLPRKELENTLESRYLFFSNKFVRLEQDLFPRTLNFYCRELVISSPKGLEWWDRNLYDYKSIGKRSELFTIEYLENRYVPEEYRMLFGNNTKISEYKHQKFCNFGAYDGYI